MPDDTRTADTAERPQHCPACGSTELGTGNKPVSSSTYWHCAKCGEVWNVGRRMQDSRFDHLTATRRTR